MRVYSATDEEKLRDAGLVREWMASGLLESAQVAALQTELRTGLRQTNGFLRAVIFVFSSLIVLAGVALLATIIKPTEHAAWAVLFLISGACCWTLAEITCANQLYRYGVEEALAVASVVLFSASATALYFYPANPEITIGLLITCFGGLAVYFRFGFVYAAIGAMISAASLPFQLDVPLEEKRLLSALILAGVAILVRRRDTQRDALTGGAWIEAAAWLGIYLRLNLHLTDFFSATPFLMFSSPLRSAAIAPPTWFHVMTWVLIWILPAAGLWLGLRRRERSLIDVGLVMALLTLTSNKRYLGWPVHSWDPLLLGIVLIAVAIVIRRWLQKGPNGVRGGYTALRILGSDERKLAAISIASAALHPNAGAPEPTQQGGFQSGGGKSGGGGATGSF